MNNLNSEQITKDTLQNLEERFENILVGSTNVELIESFDYNNKELNYEKTKNRTR